MSLRPEDCQRRNTQGKLVAFAKHSADPMALSRTSVAQQAIDLLRAWLARDALAVLQALPGYDKASQYELSHDPSASHEIPENGRSTTLGVQPQALSSVSPPGRRKSAGKSKKAGSPTGSDGDDGAGGVGSDAQEAGARVARCSNVWDVLAGQASKGYDSMSNKLSSQDAPPLAPRAWSLLHVLLEAWRSDASQHQALEWSPHLLRQFRRASSQGAPRPVSQRGPITVIFAPYLNPETLSEPNHGEDAEMLSAELMKLVGSLATAKRLDHDALVHATLQNMVQLKVEQFQQFLANQDVSTPFFGELLNRYLTIFSDPPDSASQISFAQGSFESKLALRPRRAGAVLTDDEDHSDGAVKHAAVKLAFIRHALSPQSNRYQAHLSACQTGTAANALRRSMESISAGFNFELLFRLSLVLVERGANSG